MKGSEFYGRGNQSKSSPAKDIQTFEASDGPDKWNSVTSHNEAHKIEKPKKEETPNKWLMTAAKVVGKGLMGRAKNKDAIDAAKNKGVQDAMSRPIPKI